MSINSSDKEEQEKILFLRSIKEKMETRAKRKEMDVEDTFVTSIADELRELTPIERLLAKNEIKNILFWYQMQALEKESNSNNNKNTDNPESTMFYSSAPFLLFPLVSYEKELEYEQL